MNFWPNELQPVLLIVVISEENHVRAIVLLPAHVFAQVNIRLSERVELLSFWEEATHKFPIGTQ